MRLERLVIDGHGANRHFHLDSFNPGLNVIFGDRSTGKSTVRRSIQHTIFGNQYGGPAESGDVYGGSLDIEAHGRHYRLTPRRNTDYVAGSNSPICQVEFLNGQRDSLPANSELFGGVDWELYRTFFDLEFRERHVDSRELSRVLITRLDVPVGQTRWPDHQSWQQWRREAESRANEYSAVVDQIDRLRLEQDQLTTQIRECQRRDEDRLAQIRLQIQTLNNQIDSLRGEQNSLIARKDSLVREITDLRTRIDHLLSEVQYVPAEQPGVDRLALFYERLEEIDNQLKRWRTVQGDIQRERINLRDEMNSCEDVSIDSSDHPYHTTRDIVQSLEHKIQKTEQHAQQFRADPPIRTDGGHSHQIVELCLSMRDDLYALCQELGLQYKHVRHRAAKGELKQLRKCYKELGENERRLAKRRDELLAEIRQLDPAGFDAIHHDPRFCQCAEHEGYLAARRQFVGPTHREVEYRAVQHDVTFERQRLAELEENLANCQNRITAIGDQILSDDEKLLELTAENRRLEQLDHRAELESRLADVQSELRSVEHREQILSRQIAEDRVVPETRPSDLLAAASTLLREFTSSEFDSVWIDSDSDQLCVSDSAGHEHRFGELDRGRQDQVFLATALAAVDDLRCRGMEIPVVIDDPFVNIEHGDTMPILESMVQFCRRDLQAIVLTSHRQVWDRAQEIGAAGQNHYIAWQNVPESPPIRTELHQRPATPVQRWTPPARSTSQLFQTPETRYTRPLAASPGFTAPPAPPRPVVNREPASPNQQNEITENSSLNRWPTINEQELNLLRLLGVTTAGELLDLEPEKTLDRRFLELGVDPQSVTDWQSEVLLALCVPELTFADAHYLVQCGIVDPEQLEESRMASIVEKMDRQVGSDGDNQLRLDKWRNSWRHNRSWWVGRSRYRRAQQRRIQYDRSRQRGTNRYADIRSGFPTEDRRDLDDRHELVRPSIDYDCPTSRSGSERNWSAHQMAASRKQAAIRDESEDDISFGGLRTANTTGARRSPPATSSTNGDNNQIAASTSPPKSKNGKYKFYLDLGDNLDAAPSIGAKTAERFAKIGVVNVDHFLNSSADSMAQKIAYKRITSDAIRQWQQQTNLVCRVPNLRGHDAQLLVACGITEPDELASMDPHRLFGIIKPFADSKEGTKIIRSSKKPDLAEVIDWIDWANHNRALKAA